ncbi:hypothetical protein HYZ70_02015 [Candidatus Curtissbacteria bacterium]|nr:hypothetical protein [Candidatus Curtissbacteria bacterium]
MGTTRIKVIDLSSDQKEIKTSRKHAEKLTGSPRLDQRVEAGALKLKEEKVKKTKEGERKTEEAIRERTESELESSEPSQPSVITKPTAPVTAGSISKSPKKLKQRSRKYQEVSKLIDKSKAYPVREALELLSKTSLTRFDPTVEVHLNVSEKNIRGKVNFPHPVGAKKAKRYLVFSAKRTDAKNVIWGTQDSIAEIESGKLKPGRDFDAVITTPAFMPQLAIVAKILGPRGMMPNPKNGTIQEDPARAVGAGDDSYEFRTDPTAPIVHTKIGKLSAKSDVLAQNLKTLIAAVGPTKVKKAVIKSTMSPAIKLDLNTFSTAPIPTRQVK